MSAYADSFAEYWARGWRGVFPLPAGQKFPPPNGYTGAQGAWPSYADAHAWSEEHESDGANIGIRLPANVIGLDVDHYSGKQGADVLWAKERELGALPATYRCTSRRDTPSGIRLYLVPEGLRWPGELGPGVDIIQTRHRYIVAPPSVHPSGELYAWVRPHPSLPEVPRVDELPELPEAWVSALTRGEYATEYARASVEEATELYARLAMGKPCPAVRSASMRALSRLAIADGSSRHDIALRALMRLMHLGAEGHTGAMETAAELRMAWLSSLDASRTQQQASAEWARMLRGAVSIAAATHPETPDVDPCAAAHALLPSQVTPSQSDAVELQPQQLGAPTASPVTAGDTFPAVDAHAQLVAHWVETYRAQRDARAHLDDEEHERSWREPTSYGTLRDELQLPDEEQSYRVETVIPSGSNVLLTAQYKTGKTTLVNHLTRCLVDGKPFLGSFAVHEPEHVVALWNYEVGPAQYRRWLRDVGMEHTQRVHVLHLRGLVVPMSVHRIVDWVVSWLAERNVRTWIVDPLARALSGVDENSNSEVGRYLETLDTIKSRAGVHELILPTHTGRATQEVGQERARGATRLDDWADVRWQLTKDTEGTRHFSANGRDVELPEGSLTYDPLTRDLTFNAGESRKSYTPGRGIENPQEWVMRAVTNVPGLGVNGVQRWIRDNDGSVRREKLAPAIQALVSQGLLVQVSVPRGGVALYTQAQAVSLDVSQTGSR